MLPEEVNMKDPTKRYVTVVQVLEMLNVSERTVRRWMASDPPRLHWIEDASGHKYIDLADVESIKDGKPDLTNPLPERVEILEDQVQEALTLKPDVLVLQREVEQLKGQVNTLLALMETGTSLADHSRRVHASASSQSVAEARGYPPGTDRLIDFAKQHHISISEIKELHWQREIEVSIYERSHAKRNGREWWVTPNQHRALINYYQQRGMPYQPCEQCIPVPLSLSL
jgi:hypothetical protein